MKRKIFSILACFMLCFTSLFAVTGCGTQDSTPPKEEVETPVEQDVAVSAMSTAFNALKDQNKMMLNMSVSAGFASETYELYAYKILTINSNSYEEMTDKTGAIFGSTSNIEYEKDTEWSFPTETAGKSDFYSIEETKYTDGTPTKFEYRKGYSISELDEEEMFSYVESLSGTLLENFLKAYTKGEQTYIVFEFNKETLTEIVGSLMGGGSSEENPNTEDENLSAKDVDSDNEITDNDDDLTGGSDYNSEMTAIVSMLLDMVQNVKITVAIKDNKITSIGVDVSALIDPTSLMEESSAEIQPVSVSFSLLLNIACGDDVTESIPAIPTGINWNGESD